ncbi:hypothetical protein [Roseobacter sp. A03A-229]
MLDDLSSDTVITRLDHALAHGDLSGSARSQAQDLRDRLCGGVQVVLLGPKGAGKSQLCGVMLGASLDAQDTGGSYGVRYVSSSGPATPNTDQLQTIVLSSPLLDTTTLVDVSTPTKADEMAVRLDWALGRADIVVWCTEVFGAEEAAVWAGVPDHLKDHSFLVLTKADILAAQGTMAARIAELQSIAAEEFHSFFPTSTHHIHQAMSQGDSVDDAALAASGVKALRDTLLGLAASGRQADLDRALLFLERHDAQPQEPLAKTLSDGPSVQTYQRALDLLCARIPELSSSDPNIEVSDHVLTTCGALVEDLAEFAGDQAHRNDAFEVWRNDLYEASDKVVLMGLENDMRSAADAATVILQLKRDLEERIAC